MDKDDRWKRCRARRRKHRMKVWVELGGDELDLLEASIWLTSAEAGDRVAVGDAISQALADAARRWIAMDPATRSAWRRRNVPTSRP